MGPLHQRQSLLEQILHSRPQKPAPPHRALHLLKERDLWSNRGPKGQLQALPKLGGLLHPRAQVPTSHSTHFSTMHWCTHVHRAPDHTTKHSTALAQHLTTHLAAATKCLAL